MGGTDRVDMSGPRDASPLATTARPPDNPQQTRAALLGAPPRDPRQAGALEQRAMQQLSKLLESQPGNTPTEKLTNALKAAGLDDAAIAQMRDTSGNISLTAAREALLKQLQEKNPQAAQALARAPLGQLLAAAQKLNGGEQQPDQDRQQDQRAPQQRPRTQRPRRASNTRPGQALQRPRTARHTGVRPRRVQDTQRTERRPAAQPTGQQVGERITTYWNGLTPAQRNRESAEQVWSVLRQRPDALRHVEPRVMAEINGNTPTRALPER